MDKFDCQHSQLENQRDPLALEQLLVVPSRDNNEFFGQVQSLLVDVSDLDLVLIVLFHHLEVLQHAGKRVSLRVFGAVVSLALQLHLREYLAHFLSFNFRRVFELPKLLDLL